MRFYKRQAMRSDKADSISASYQRHLDAINLSPSTRELANLNAHDDYVMDVTNDPSGSSLQLRLRCGDLQVGYFDALLDFSGVSIDPPHLKSLIHAMRPAGCHDSGTPASC